MLANTFSNCPPVGDVNVHVKTNAWTSLISFVPSTAANETTMATPTDAIVLLLAPLRIAKNANAANKADIISRPHSDRVGTVVAGP